MAEKAPIYETLEQAPEPWRRLYGARLGLEQLNGILERAYELGEEGVPAYGEAQRTFMELHEQVDGLWVRRPSN